MAIRLASAIGEQRDKNPYEGMGDAIAKQGAGIVDALGKNIVKKEKAAAEEQALKKLISRSIKVKPLDNALPKDRQEYEDYANQGVYEISKASLDKKVRPAELEKMQRDFIQGLEQRQYLYQRDYKRMLKLLEDKESGGVLVENFENFITGKDFAPKSEESGMPLNTDWKPTNEAANLNTPYFDKSLQERLATNIDDEYSKRTSRVAPNIKETVKDVFSSEFDPDIYVTKTQNSLGGFDFSKDEKRIQNDADRYAVKMVGETNYGKNHVLTKSAMEQQAVTALLNSGFRGEELAKEIPNLVYEMARGQYIEMANAAADDRMKNQKEEPYRKPTKESGSGINISVGGGGETKQWRISAPKNLNLRTGHTTITTTDPKTKEKITKPGKAGELTKYDYFSIQTVSTGENPKKISFGDYSDVQLNGVLKNPKTGEIDYVKITQPATDYKKAKVIFAKIKDPSDLDDIKNNIGEDIFDKAIGLGKYATKKAEPKKESNKSTSQKSQVIQGKTIPAGGVPKYSKSTGKLIGYELNGEKYKF